MDLRTLDELDSAYKSESLTGSQSLTGSSSHVEPHDCNGPSWI